MPLLAIDTKLDRVLSDYKEAYPDQTRSVQLYEVNCNQCFSSPRNLMFCQTCILKQYSNGSDLFS